MNPAEQEHADFVAGAATEMKTYWQCVRARWRSIHDQFSIFECLREILDNVLVNCVLLASPLLVLIGGWREYRAQTRCKSCGIGRVCADPKTYE